MRSMTGFGRGSAAGDGWEIALQVSSVNRKSLEVALSMPREWQVFEPEITAAVRGRVSRGRVQVSTAVRGPAANGLAWDDAVIEAALDRLAALSAKRGIPFQVTPELMFQIVTASRADAVTLPPEKALALILAALEPAMDELGTMREREGEILSHDITERVAALSAAVEIIAARAPVTLQSYREMLLQRLRQAGLDLDLDDERVLKEIALFADRIDISEELTRLRSHLEHLAQLAQSTEPIGRKAEFLLQEIGREIHTVGSKANDLEIARAVIEFKNEVERIREQAQNIE
jgi:uncharacterized protein (TIGR00255 family)